MIDKVQTHIFDFRIAGNNSKFYQIQINHNKVRDLRCINAQNLTEIDNFPLAVCHFLLLI